MSSIRVLFLMLVFSLQAYSTELPQFCVVKEVLDESEMVQLQQLTEEFKPESLWYGRYNFWRENFEASDQTITHFTEHPSNAVSDKLTTLFLDKVKEFGVDISNKRIVLESYLDRNIVNLENAPTSGMFWHRDTIIVDGKKEVADFTMILLMNEQVWEGADLVLQLGGDYSEKGSYTWVNSDFPKITLTPRYNQAIIFKNSDAAHMVTPLIPLASTVQRDVFIITCYFLP